MSKSVPGPDKDEIMRIVDKEATLTAGFMFNQPSIVKFYRDAYERGFIDGMQEQARSTVDRAINAMTEARK